MADTPNLTWELATFEDNTTLTEHVSDGYIHVLHFSKRNKQNTVSFCDEYASLFFYIHRTIRFFLNELINSNLCLKGKEY